MPVALAVTLPAQDAPLGATRYAVAYVEVQRSAFTPFRAAFTRYQDASRGDAGFTTFELLQDAGRPGQFVIVETWRDQAAMDAHAQAPHTLRFRDALVPIRVGGYDERPYKALTVAAAHAAASGAPVYVVTHVDIAPPGDATMLLTRLADESRRDAGCLRFDVLQHAAHANHFTMIEGWRNQQAHDEHVEAMHTRRYRDALQPMLGGPLDERLMRRR